MKTDFLLVFIVFLSLNIAYNIWENKVNIIADIFQKIGIGQQSNGEQALDEPLSLSTHQLETVNNEISQYQSQLIKISSLPQVLPLAPPVPPSVPPVVIEHRTLSQLPIQSSTLQQPPITNPPPEIQKQPVPSSAELTEPRSSTRNFDASLLFSNEPNRRPGRNDVIVFVHIPKTAGSVFFDKMRGRAKGLKYYPDGQHSFHDRGCGEKGGTAHCDYTELAMCFEKDYTKGMPSHLLRPATQLKYVTLLREPVQRVVSEYFWGCGAKVNKRFTGEHEGKVLFDWPRSLWNNMANSCLKGAPLAELQKWFKEPSNPAHNRYMKMLADNSAASTLSRKHNCIIGNEADSMAVWGGRYGVKSGDASAPKSRGELWQTLNRDHKLFEEVMDIIENRFWFVGILEELDLSMSVFCALGVCNLPSSDTRRKGRFPRPRRLTHFEEGLLEEEEAQEEGNWLQRPTNEVYMSSSEDRIDQEEEASDDDTDMIEVFEDSIRKEATGGRRRKLLQKHSAKPSNFKLDPASRSEISKLNALDVKLYHHCRERLHKVAIKYAPDAAKKMKLF
jgi:hypothetical protein